MAGLKVVPVKTHADGNLDLEDLRSKAEQHKDNLAAFMVSTRLHRVLRRFSRSTHPDHVPLDLRCLRAWCPGCEGYVRSGHDLN